MGFYRTIIILQIILAGKSILNMFENSSEKQWNKLIPHILLNTVRPTGLDRQLSLKLGLWQPAEPQL